MMVGSLVVYLAHYLAEMMVEMKVDHSAGLSVEQLDESME
jgi:hypothetical protein